MLLLLLVGMVVVLLLVILILGLALALAIGRLRKANLEDSNKSAIVDNKIAADDDDEQSIGNPSYSRPAPGIFLSLEENLQQLEEPTTVSQEGSVHSHESQHRKPNSHAEEIPITATRMVRLGAARDINFPIHGTYTPATPLHVRMGILTQSNVSYTTTIPSHPQMAKTEQGAGNAVADDSNPFYELIRTASTSNNYDHHPQDSATSPDYQSLPNHHCHAAPILSIQDTKEEEVESNPPTTSLPPLPSCRRTNVTL